MIIKATRGNDFDGLFAYVLRHGQHRHLGEAQIIAMEGVYNERTAAAQMTYNAALAPSRTRPVVHLMGRAEKSLTEEQYATLAQRVMRAARLEGRPYVAVVHDDGHLHVVACEMDDEGNPPARWHWNAVEKREVREHEAQAAPRGSVKSRAWDSHLAWRLTELARELEVEWGLTRLSSAPQQRHETPQVDRWQQERLERSAEAPLQDRYREQVRAALAFSRWDDRIAALAQHGLTVRAHRVGEKVRGLQVQSLSNSADFVKISAFDLGGMAKLDATADRPFLEWERERRAAKVNLRKINLRKPEPTFDPEMARLRASFRDELKAWHVSRGRRTKAFKQYRRDKAVIQADLASFDQTMSAHLSPAGLRAARREKRGGMQVMAKASLNYEMTLAGPERPRPIFIDFVKARAGTGDVGAARLYRDIMGGVTETQRREKDRKVAELAAAARDLKARANAMAAALKRSGEQMRLIVRDLAARADKQRVKIIAATVVAADATRGRAEYLAIRLAQRIDAAAHRIRVDRDGRVRIDRWTGSADERRLVEDRKHQPVFRRWAQVQGREIATLSREVLARSAVHTVDGRLAADTARLPADVLPFVRWAAEPEIVAALNSADRASKATAAWRAREDAVHRESEARAAAEQYRAERVEAMAAKLRAVTASSQAIVSGIGQRDDKAEKTPVRPAAMATAHARLLAAAAPRTTDGSATRAYLEAWTLALRKRPPEHPLSPHDLYGIDLSATKLIIGGGFSADAVQRVVAERSPAGSDAAEIFEEALRDPAIRRAHDDHVETADRRETEMRLRERPTLNEAGERFVDLWVEILSERPLDPSIIPSERNRAVDYEVATAMLAENHNLQQVQQLVVGLSPAARTARPCDRASYVDTLMENLADRLPDGDPRRARVPLSRLIDRPVPVEDDNGPARTIPVDAIANALPSLEEVAGLPDASGSVIVGGWSLVVADLRVGESAGEEHPKGRDVPKSRDAHLVGEAGRRPEHLVDDQGVQRVAHASQNKKVTASAARDQNDGRDR